jgi:hypothetical protein
MKCGFSIEFSTIRSPNRVLTPLKSASFEIRISSFVHPSSIFVWGGVKFWLISRIYRTKMVQRRRVRTSTRPNDFLIKED